MPAKKHPPFPLADKKGKIAFQGKPAAYSHLACLHCYPNHQPIPYDDFESVFQAVAKNQCDLAMIPIQNSTGGRVADIHLLLPQTNLFIIAEYFQPINHCLLATKNSDLKKIKEVYSHPQALMQCRKNLQKLKLHGVEFADTAGAAAMIADKNNPEKAALASDLSADIYGLKIIKKNMEDHHSNITRFLVLSKKQIIPQENPQKNITITAMIFTLKSIPAALYKCLGGFATNNINLVKLESYIPMLDDEGSAEFYIEFIGNPESVAVKNALEELKTFAHDIRPLGSFTRSTL